MEWSPKTIISLIKQFEKHECLWNVGVKEYRNILKKKEAWHKIGANLSASDEVVEKKMKTLLASFRREKKKVLDSKKSGNYADDIYVPRWFCYKHMRFLQDISRRIKTRESDQKRKIGKILDEGADKEIEKSEENSNEGSTNDVTKSIENVICSQTEQRQQRKQKSNCTGEVDIAFLTMQTLWEEKLLRQKDQYSAFGEVVAHKIRKLPTDSERNLVEFKINELLFQASIGNFR